jgi:hypothetical protein
LVPYWPDTRGTTCELNNDKGDISGREAGKDVADGIEIRRLEAGDRADWDRLWADYLAFYETERPRP